MNITISKEGSNPVTIDTIDGKIVRSTEGVIKDAGGVSKANVANSALTVGTGAGVGIANYIATKYPKEVCKRIFEATKFLASKIYTAAEGVPKNNAMAKACQIIAKNMDKVAANGGYAKALAGSKDLMQQAALGAKAMTPEVVGKASAQWFNKIVLTPLNKMFGTNFVPDEKFWGGFGNFIGGINKSNSMAYDKAAEIFGKDLIKEKSKVFAKEVSKKTGDTLADMSKSTRELGEKFVSKADKEAIAKGGKFFASKADKAAAAAAQAKIDTMGSVGKGVITYAAMTAIKSALGTIYNAATSIGSFNSGDEMLDSDNLKKALGKKILSNKKYQYPTVDEVKASSKAKNKSGFLAWLFGGQSAGTKVSSMVGSTAMKIKIVSGVPVSVVKLNPLMGSKDLAQLGGMRVLVATAFVKDSKGNIKSIPLCRGYLTRGNLVNASREAADIFFSEESETPITKKDIINYISMSRESSNPKLNDEMMFFLREATI